MLLPQLIQGAGSLPLSCRSRCRRHRPGWRIGPIPRTHIRTQLEILQKVERSSVERCFLLHLRFVWEWAFLTTVPNKIQVTNAKLPSPIGDSCRNPGTPNAHILLPKRWPAGCSPAQCSRQISRSHPSGDNTTQVPPPYHNTSACPLQSVRTHLKNLHTPQKFRSGPEHPNKRPDLFCLLNLPCAIRSRICVGASVRSAMRGRDSAEPAPFM